MLPLEYLSAGSGTLLRHQPSMAVLVRDSAWIRSPQFPCHTGTHHSFTLGGFSLPAAAVNDSAVQTATKSSSHIL